MNTKLFILGLAITILSCSPKKDTKDINQKQPNVLFLFCDDLNDVVLGGHPQCISPNIDKLAAMGVSFTNAHTNSPLCAPSRASMLTGLMPQTSGYFGGKQYNWRENPNLAKAQTMMEHFRANNYKIMGTGKIFHHKHQDTTVWINNDGTYQYGEDFSFGPFPWDGKDNSQNGWGITHPDFPSLHTDALITSLANVPDVKPDPEHGIPGNKGWRLRYKPFKYNSEDDRDLMPDELNAKWAVEKLNEKHDKPFMLCVGFNRPHAPYIAPQKYFDMFPLEAIQLAKTYENDIDDCASILVDSTDYGTGNHGYFNYNTVNGLGPDGLKKWTQAYLSCVAYVDEQIGKILTALENSEYADNTIIVFSSDHGYHMGQKNWLFKNTLWGKATRIPYMIAGPGINKHKSTNAPVSLVDIYPTLIDLCHLTEHPNANTNKLELDGQSLRPILTGENNSKLRDYTIAYVSSDKYKENPGEVGTYTHHHTAIITDSYRYIRCYNGEEELYDTKNDPDEVTNLVNDKEFKDILKSFRDRYDHIGK